MKIRIGILIVLLTLSIGCNKEEGPGGFSTIKGTLMVQDINRNNEVLDTYPAAKEDIFIIYGNGDYFNDELETSHDGYFEFNNLTDGNYTLWYYSDDTTTHSPEGNTVYMHEISIGKKETKTIDMLYTYNYLDLDEGSSSITGKVYLINYYAKVSGTYTTSDIKDITPAQETNIYIVYEDDEYYFDRTRTNYNGIFRFENLIKGNYRVYVYSEDIEGGIYNSSSENVIFEPASQGTFDVVVYRNVNVTENHQEITVTDMYIEKI